MAAFKQVCLVLMAALAIGCAPEGADQDEDIVVIDGPQGGAMDTVGGGGDGDGDDDGMGGNAMIPPDVAPPEPIIVPEFGRSAERVFPVHARRSDGLAHPRDLEFDPAEPNNLWVVDRDWDGNIIIFDADQEGARVERMRDMAASHFMEEVSSMAFSDNGNFGTCQESRNGLDGLGFEDDFMGPVLWSADLMIHCNVNQQEGGFLNGSHLDMLHQSPLCMGMAAETGNAFYVADGANGHVVRYDFRRPHVPGGDDHSDGEVTRYPDLSFTRVPDIPSHMQMVGDDLYYVDTGTGTIKVADMTTGSESGRLIAVNEPLARFDRYSGVSVRTFADGLDTPSGLLVTDERVFVSLPLTGEIVAYDLEGQELQRVDTGPAGVMGLAMGPEGRIWFTNAYEGTVQVLDPGPVEKPAAAERERPMQGACMYPEWTRDIGVGHVLPPYAWNAARSAGQAAAPLSAVDMFCGDDWADVSVIVFVLVAEWSPWIFDYVAYVDALTPRIEEAGGRVVFVGAQDRNGGVLNGVTTDRLLGDFAPQGNGIRVGERDSTFASKLMDSGLVDHLPSAFVVRRSDMRVLATQRDRFMEHLPYVEMAMDPNADWSNPGPAEIVPIIPSNCDPGVEEDFEPNDQPTQAGRVVAGSYEGGVCDRRRGDFYFVDIDGPWTLELKFRHSVGDLDIALFDQGRPLMDNSGRPAGPASGDDNEYMEWRGPVTIYIYGYAGATSPYRLIIRD